MSTSQNRTVVWIVAAVLLALVCCLCLVLVATGASIYLTTTSVEVSPTRVPPPLAPTPDVQDSSWSSEEVPPEARAVHDELRAEVVPIADPIALAERLGGQAGIPEVMAGSAAPVPLGTVRTFWASNTDTQESFQVDAELAYATDHVYFWVEQGVEYDQGELEALVDEFEQQSYPTNREFFGSEWSPGVDGDVHLYILLADGLGVNLAGYYSSVDEYSPLAHEYSNSHEMFYLMAGNVDLADAYTAGVLAHEFQHMIHWYRDQNEDTWMNEGFSMVAEHLNGFDIGGFDFMYAVEPDQTLANWPGGTEENSGHYGQAFLVLTYFLDRFGPEATQALVANPANGFDSIDQILRELGATDPSTGQAISADDVFLDWALAMLLQDPSLADGRYGYTSYTNAPEPAFAETVTDCPVTDQARNVSQYGVDYIQLTCGGSYNLALEGATLVPILPAEAHSGDFAFWTNRGDTSDMTLTRAFDLSDVSGPAALEYSLWYDIEEGYDYVYLEVSEDGGETWTILETPSGTTEDPSGNSYGWGYNAMSGGGEQAEWIQERVDLSAYAGQEILVRFEYVTDAAVNGEGLLLDDVRLDALGYAEDFEGGHGGWGAEGFVRLYNQLPQTFRAALVELGGEPRVTYLTLDENGRVEVPLDIRDEAVLVITGTARHTWQPGAYRYSLTPAD
jgi:hypothetical protein